jgi:hypothetical protein
MRCSREKARMPRSSEGGGAFLSRKEETSKTFLSHSFRLKIRRRKKNEGGNIPK